MSNITFKVYESIGFGRVNTKGIFAYSLVKNGDDKEQNKNICPCCFESNLKVDITNTMNCNMCSFCKHYYLSKLNNYPLIGKYNKWFQYDKHLQTFTIFDMTGVELSVHSIVIQNMPEMIREIELCESSILFV